MQLSEEQACMSNEALQAELRQELETNVKRTASSVATVQILSLSVSSPGIDCESRRAAQSGSSADVEMMIVFSKGPRPTFNVEAFAA
eukprot:1914893-Rhodomonas_salina.1